MTITYEMDKETKGTFRFAPVNCKDIGIATLYLPKDFCRSMGIDPRAGMLVTLEPKQTAVRVNT